MNDGASVLTVGTQQTCRVILGVRRRKCNLGSLSGEKAEQPGVSKKMLKIIFLI